MSSQKQTNNPIWRPPPAIDLWGASFCRPSIKSTHEAFANPALARPRPASLWFRLTGLCGALFRFHRGTIKESAAYAVNQENRKEPQGRSCIEIAWRILENHKKQKPSREVRKRKIDEVEVGCDRAWENGGGQDRPAEGFWD